MDRLPFDPDRASGAKPSDIESSAKSKPRGSANPNAAISVSQLTGWIADALDDALPNTLHVVGELSNFKRHGSGHLYFTLKDDRSELACVMWRSAAGKLKFRPEDGMSVVLSGNVAVFERAGRYQFYVRSIVPKGAGALELAFRQLREKLAAEGLFDPSHKKSLPRFPNRIGVITSSTGAAVRDITTTLARRYPIAEIVLLPVAVQGPSAAGEVAAAITRLNRLAQSTGAATGKIDVIIVGRGGGSIEDLWAFNEETVARAIHASRIPIISAVGHETDTTIADLVADVRAATPTAAAEIAAPDAADIGDELEYRRSHLNRGLRHALELARSHLARIAQRHLWSKPQSIIETRQRAVTDLDRDLKRAARDRLTALDRRVHRAQLLLNQIDPHRSVSAAARRLIDLQHRLRFAIQTTIAGGRRKTELSSQRLASALLPSHVIKPRRDAVSKAQTSLNLSAIHHVGELAQRLRTSEARLAALDYRATLNRGFSITRRSKTDRIVRGAGELSEGDRIVTRLAEGEVHSRVENPDQKGLFD